MVKTVGSKIYSLLGPETSVSNQGPGSSQRSASCPSKKAEPIGEEGTSFGTTWVQVFFDTMICFPLGGYPVVALLDGMVLIVLFFIL